ncbi:MAG: glycosyltransferase family 9 protein [Candidatus Kryptoniota bacterium]
MPESINRKLEAIGKRITRRLLAALASRHRRTWFGIGENKDTKRIIVVRQHNQFGDVLCTIPLLRALHKKFDPEELAVVVSPQNIDAIRGCKYVTNIINYDKLSFYRRPSQFIAFCKQLRRSYDILLVPSNVSMSLTNDVMAFFIKAKTKIGPKSLEGRSNKTSSVYDLALDLKWDKAIMHQTLRNMKVASPLEIIPESKDGELESEVDENALDAVNSFLRAFGDDSPRKIALHAGAGKVCNRWGAVNFVKLSELLHDSLNAELYFTEGSFDHEIMEQITSTIKVPFVRVRNKTIPFVAALLKRMDIVITNDTGIMHLAAAVGTRTLSLFGPTDPLQWAPLGKQHRFILGSGGDMKTIDVSKTFDVAKKLLQIN